MKFNRRKRKEKSKVDGLPGLRVGPGGINCCCCFPAPGTRARRRMFKTARRKAKAQALKEQRDY
jgi:hypothetical protein